MKVVEDQCGPEGWYQDLGERKVRSFRDFLGSHVQGDTTCRGAGETGLAEGELTVW